MDDLPQVYSEMGGFPIDHSDQPIRLFKSNFLEFFTHISPLVVVLIWLPVAVWLLARSISDYHGAKFPVYIPLCMIFGIFLWTFAEYTLHRYVFHFHAQSTTMKRLVFLFHGIHHAQPQCKTRLVMPPAVSVPMALVFYGIFYAVAGLALGSPQLVAPLLAGFMVAYLIYDLTHYATHHYPMRKGYLRFLKRHHMQHHFKTPDQRFGVSSPFWDVVFGTLPR